MPPRRPDPQRLRAALDAQRSALGQEPWAGPAEPAVLGRALAFAVAEALEADAEPHREALRAAMTLGAPDYFITDAAGDSGDTVPESSRRARAIPVWALLRALGRQGVADLVDGFCRHAQAFADGIKAIDGGRVENDVVFSQVSASFGSDERTQQVAARLMVDGTAWMTGSRWHDKTVLRISVSNWSTTADDVQRSLAALRSAAG